MSSRPEPVEPPARPVAVERVGDVSWRPVVAVALITVSAFLVILSPWDTRPPPAQLTMHSDATIAAAVALPSPTIDPAIDAASGRMLCNAPPGWRLISMETSPLGSSRTMYGMEPVNAWGPSDPSIPTSELKATLMLGVGVCRPNPGGLRVADLPLNAITIWGDSDPSSPRSIVDPYVLDDSLFRLGEVYLGPPRPPTNSPDDWPTSSPDRAVEMPTWQPGRYVLEIDEAGSGGAALWLALDFSNIRPKTAAVTVQ